MTIFSHIKRLFHSEPEEQVLGYSPLELRRLFQNPALAHFTLFLKAYPEKSSLEPAGIHAVYAALQIDKSDRENFMKRVDARFQPEARRRFQGAEVVQSRGRTSDHRLCCVVTDELGGLAVRIVTDNLDFLNDIDQCSFSVPPPWVAFEGYNPHGWGGSMQGAQEYYDDTFFAPFFLSLDAEQKKAYCEKYDASPDWAKALALFYDDDEEQ